MDLRFDTHATLKAVESDGDGWGRFTGVASVDELDLQGDVVEAGAFEPVNPERVACLYGHDSSQPIGRWSSLRTVGRKLIAEGELMLSLPKAAEVYAMIKNRVLTGLSVGFKSEPASVV